MILSLAIVSGFQQEIRDKVIGFGSHIQINHFESRNAYETKPVPRSMPVLAELRERDEIRHIQPFALKAGILKTESEIKANVLKGIDQEFDWDFFESKIISGASFRLDSTKKSKDIVISRITADELQLDTGESIVIYFIQDPPRMRKFRIAGIYETGFTQFDELYSLVDMRHIQKLNDWSDDQVSGFEILINNFNQLEDIDEVVYQRIPHDLHTTTIVESIPDVFNWLKLQDDNVEVIITLMLLVAAINIISALLILILDKVRMIGMLKTLGASNWRVRKIFLWKSAYLIGSGLFWGNVVGIGICLLQDHYHWIKLPQESYYVSSVPILLNLRHLLMLNAGTFLLCMILLVIPTYVISTLRPVKTVKFS